MQSQRYVQFSLGLTPFVAAAALMIGAIGGYTFRATMIQLTPVAASTEASGSDHTVLIPRSVREGEAARTILIPRSVREGDGPAAAPSETIPGTPEITR